MGTTAASSGGLIGNCMPCSPPVDDDSEFPAFSNLVPFACVAAAAFRLPYLAEEGITFQPVS